LQDGEAYWAPAKLYWSVWNQSRVEQLSKYWPDARNESDDADYLRRRRRGYPDDEVSTTIDITPQLEAKFEAIAAHRTQIPSDWLFMRVPEAERPAMFGTETFVRIYSAVDSPVPETDLFAGLR
jgi:mycothiol S-conjugate amidase